MILQPDKLQSKPTKKPRLNGLALAFQNPRPGQSRHEAVITARLGLAYLGLAWLGSRPQAGPGTALELMFKKHSWLSSESQLSLC